MTQPTAAQGKLIDKNNNPQIQDRQAAIVRITISNGGTPGSSLNFTTNPVDDATASCNSKLVEILDVMRYHGLIAGGTQVTAAEARFVDKNNNPMIGDQPAAITALTDNTTGTPDDVIDYAFPVFRDDMASLATQVNSMLDVFEYHGLNTGSGTQVTEAVSKFIDTSNVPQLGDQQAAIPDLTDNTGGTISDAVPNTGTSSKEDFVEIVTKTNEMIELLELHGLIADN